VHIKEKVHPASEQGIGAIQGINDELFVDKVEKAGKALSECARG
jgi:hypothetical protein